MKGYFRELSVAGTCLVLLLFLAVKAPSFFQGQPLLSLLTREAPTLVVASGMALVLICRQIDISVGSQFAVCSVCGGLLSGLGWPLGAVMPIMVLLGAGLGAINGALVAGLGLPSIVVTLAMMVTLREGLRWLRQGQFVTLPEGVQWLGFPQGAGQWLVIFACLGLFALLALALRHLVGGRLIYAVGSDAEAARLAGLRPRLITFVTFVMLGGLTALAALFTLVQSPQVDPKTGTGLELKAIAGAVVGGVAISGGRGRLVGVLVGLLLLAIISPALTYLLLPSFWEKAIQGGVILLAVMADGWRLRRGRGI